MSRKCVRCGEPLPEGCAKKRVFCDECRRQYQREYVAQNRSYIRQQEREREARKRAAARAKAKESDPKSLSQLAREAHELQITYGKYMELLAGGGLERYCREHGLKMPEEK